MKASAAVAWSKGESLTIETIELDEPQDNEVLVRIVGAGLCHTDVIMRDQYYPLPMPLILGHEGAGVVTKVGAGVTKVAPGDHVILTYRTCGHCKNCVQAMPCYCENIYPLNFRCCRPDGSSTVRGEARGCAIHGSFFGQSSFATHALASERNVIKVEKDIPLEVLAPIGCGVHTGAGTVMNLLKPGVGSNLIVFGVGSVGLSAVMAARIMGCAKIVAVDRVDSRLALAKEVGATHAFAALTPELVNIIREAIGDGADYAIDTTGNHDIIRLAMECLRAPGTCAVIGGTHGGQNLTLKYDSLFYGRTVVGAVGGACNHEMLFPQLIEYYRQGRFPFDKLITYYKLDEVNRALEDTARGDVVKAVLTP
jgi:aryl-alcohol dehydrogenase